MQLQAHRARLSAEGFATTPQPHTHVPEHYTKTLQATVLSRARKHAAAIGGVTEIVLTTLTLSGAMDRPVELGCRQGLKNRRDKTRTGSMVLCLPDGYQVLRILT